jgi:hypothetical protein
VDITIIATANGSLTPPQNPSAATITNGNFTIVGTPNAGATGDGKDEATRWSFDFNIDPNYPQFSPTLPVASAKLTLQLTAKGPQINNDTVQIALAGFSAISDSTIQGIPNNTTKLVTLQLLTHYTSAQILSALASGGGVIPMGYQDDAIVSSARLELVQHLPRLQYAAKFVCGRSDGPVVAPGQYFTAINVHNPTYKPVKFRMKVAVALPGLQPGPVSSFYSCHLGADQAFEVDCPDIHKLAHSDEPFLKGFVVIESDVELDVVAVYTAAGADGFVETIHTERVPARRRASRPFYLEAADLAADESQS